jgi:hypothetical protein
VYSFVLISQYDEAQGRISHLKEEEKNEMMYKFTCSKKKRLKKRERKYTTY